MVERERGQSEGKDDAVASMVIERLIRSALSIGTPPLGAFLEACSSEMSGQSDRSIEVRFSFTQHATKSLTSAICGTLACSHVVPMGCGYGM